MRLVCLPLLGILLLGCSSEETPQKKANEIEGTWKFVDEKFDKLGIKHVAEITDEKIIQRVGKEGKEKEISFTYTLKPKTDPKEIDIVESTAIGKSVTRQGIYRLEDDKLTILIGFRKRPASFDKKIGTMRWEYERVK